MSLIAVCGVDGCGKDSVADAVAKAIGADRLNFPDRRSITGKAIDRYLRGEWAVCAPFNAGAGVVDQPLSALSMQALALANRLEQWPALSSAAGSRDRHLVLARYFPSGWVYGQLDGLDRKWIDLVNAPFPQPDLCVLLDAAPETCMARRAARDGKATAPERYEGKLDRTRKIVSLYRELWGEGRRGFMVVDAEQPIESVVARVVELAQRI